MHPSRQAYVEEAEPEVSLIPHHQHTFPKFIHSIHMDPEGRRDMNLGNGE